MKKLYNFEARNEDSIWYLPILSSSINLRRCPLINEISLKVICEKSNFQSMIFAIMFVSTNGHTYKLFKSILNDFLAKGKGEINLYGLT